MTHCELLQQCKKKKLKKIGISPKSCILLQLFEVICVGNVLIVK